MRVARWGLLIGTGLVIVVAGWWSCCGDVFAQRSSEFSVPRRGDQIIALTTPGGQGEHFITLIDQQLRKMSVYSIAPGSGEIALKSVRNFHWDLQMEEFNGVSPLPREIRAMLEPR